MILTKDHVSLFLSDTLRQLKVDTPYVYIHLSMIPSNHVSLALDQDKITRLIDKYPCPKALIETHIPYIHTTTKTQYPTYTLTEYIMTFETNIIDQHYILQGLYTTPFLAQRPPEHAHFNYTPIATTISLISTLDSQVFSQRELTDPIATDIQQLFSTL
jgi:hypothetical protein